MTRRAATAAPIAAVGAVLLTAAATWPPGMTVVARALRHSSGQSRAESRGAAAYADGAPPGFSGGFGEQACDACHFEAALNTKPGQLTLAGVPEQFVAGERYPLTITLSRPGMAMGGFQLAARRADDGAQAGTLAPGPGEETRIRIERGTVQYANQRQEGASLAGPGLSRWTVVWTAPATPGVVLFHVAANAADKDEAARGDYVYTATAASRPR